MVLPGESAQRAGVSTAWYRGAEGTTDTSQTGETAGRQPFTPGYQLTQLLQAVAASPEARQVHGGAEAGNNNNNFTQQRAPTPAATNEERGAVVVALERIMQANDEEASNYEFTWQKARYDSTEGAQGVKEEMLAPLTSVKVYAVMEKDDCFVRMVHGLGRYFNSTAAPELRGKELGRCGEWTSFSNPIVVKLQDHVPWKWKRVSIGSDVQAWEVHERSAGNRGKFFKHPTTQVVSVTVPTTLALPSVLAKLGMEAARTPFEFYKFCEQLAEDEHSGVSEEMIDPFKDWFKAAGQIEPGKSCCGVQQVLQSVNCFDTKFSKWAFEHCKMYLGPGPTANVPTASTPQPAQQIHQGFSIHQVSNFISQLTQTPVQPRAQKQATTSEKDAGKPLTEYQLAALKGFSGVTRAEQCSHIYATFQTSKSYLDHREEIMRQMKELAFALGIEIDEGFFLSKEVVEDMVQVKPNVNGIIATSKTIERGVSNMVVLPRRQDDIEERLLAEEAAARTEGARSLKDAQSLVKSETRAPPSTYATLRTNVATYAVLLQVLYTKNCGHCEKVWHIYRLLKSPQAATI